MNTASALIKQVLVLKDSDTWTDLRKHYLPTELHTLYSLIEKHSKKYHKLPSFDDLKFEIRDNKTREKLLAIESLNVEVDAYKLLEYLKNEYTQKEILTSLDTYIDQTVAFEDAEESVAHLHQIVLDIEERVDLGNPAESMQRIALFDDEETLQRYVKLGLNEEFDETVQFSPTDLIMFGGKRGAGKSLTCANIASNMFMQGRSSMYFTIEMPSRDILQRCCSISTGIPMSRIRSQVLSLTEWQKVAEWWASRFEGGGEHYNEYLKHRNFREFHKNLVTTCSLYEDKQIDVVYEPDMTVNKIIAELNKKVEQLKPSVILVDYINKVKRSAISHRSSHYDWTEQIEVSRALKSLAQEYEVPIISPYQIDKTGEARFAKGILDDADAAYILDPHSKDDHCVTFECVKMRAGNDEVSFTSKMDWDCLKMGPESSMTPKEREDSEHKTGEEIDDV